MRRTKRTPGWPAQPKERGPNGRPLCRGRCGREVAKGCRAWCSGECEADANIRAGWHVRHYVWERDGGVCALCGCDAEKVERVLRYLRVYRTFDFAAYCEAKGLLREAWAAGREGALLEADHVVPVAEGGGGCGLEGYRTLCRPCHLAETRALRARLAARRRESLTRS